VLLELVSSWRSYAPWLEDVLPRKSATEVAPGDLFVEKHTMDLRLQVRRELCDSQGNVVYEGKAEITLETALRAVEAWQRGQDFTPKQPSGS
jgi:hypothetical protein